MGPILSVLGRVCPERPPGDTLGEMRGASNWQVRGRWRALCATAAALAGSVSILGAVIGSPAAAAPTNMLRPPRVPSYGAYLGASPNFTTGNTAALAHVLEGQIGRNLAIVAFYTSFGAMPPLQDLQAVSAAGSIPLVNMHCSGLDAAVASGEFDLQLRALARSYRSFGRPILVRWFWEMNLTSVSGHRACLGPNASTWSSDYIAAFRHIWTIFHAEGATNVAFVWCPSDARGVTNNENVNVFFPGTKYVDWIGADLYDKPGRRPRTFQSVFGPFYRYWADPAHGGGRPMIICETGSPGSGQLAWLSEIESSFELQFPDVHGLVYYDANAAFDYRLVPGVAGMKQFVTMGHTVYFNPFGPYTGFVTATKSGGIFAFGAPSYGSSAGHVPAPIVAIATEGAGAGYWLAGADGSIYTFGHARNFGSMRGKRLNKPIVGMAALPNGAGYWLVASDGGIFSFGAARFHGSMGGHHLNKPIVGMAASPHGQGYWFVAADGGIFTFGDARFYGSTGWIHLRRPIDGMATTVGGAGYWLVASDGGIFTFGDARFLGSLAAAHLRYTVGGIGADPSGGYRVVASNGTVYQFPGGTAFPNRQAVGAVGVATA